MKESADVILINAKVYKADSLFTEAEAFAIRDGKFIRVGKTGDILADFHSGKIIDAYGKPVYPGFIDAHCHFYGYALSLQQINLTGTKSFSEVVERLIKDSADYFQVVPFFGSKYYQKDPFWIKKKDFS